MPNPIQNTTNTTYSTSVGYYAVDSSKLAPTDVAILQGGKATQKQLVEMVGKYPGVSFRLVAGPRELDLPRTDTGGVNWDQVEDDINALVAFCQAALMNTNQAARKLALTQAMEALTNMLVKATAALEKEKDSFASTAAGQRLSAITKIAGAGMQGALAGVGGLNVRASFKFSNEASKVESGKIDLPSGPVGQVKAARLEAQTLFGAEDKALRTDVATQSSKLDKMKADAPAKRKAEREDAQKSIDKEFKFEQSKLNDNIDLNKTAKAAAIKNKSDLEGKIDRAAGQIRSLNRQMEAPVLGSADDLKALKARKDDLVQSREKDIAALNAVKANSTTLDTEGAQLQQQARAIMPGHLKAKADCDASFAAKEKEVDPEITAQKQVVAKAEKAVQKNQKDWDEYNTKTDAWLETNKPPATIFDNLSAADIRQMAEGKMNMSRVWSGIGQSGSPMISGTGEAVASVDQQRGSEEGAVAKFIHTEADMANALYQMIMEFANSLKAAIDEGRQSMKDVNQSTQQALTASAQKLV